MPRGKPLSKDLRVSIIKAHEKGISARRISVSHSIPRSTVQDIINLYRRTGGVDQKVKTGRPSTITEANKRALRRIVKTNRRSNTKEITALWRDSTAKPISMSTTKRTIRKIGFKFYKAKEKPLLTKLQRRNRLKWAREHKNWTNQQWHSVIWSDESKFDVCVGDTRKRVLRTPSEAYHNDCLVKKVKFPASVMVWGCMSGRGVGKLHFVDGIVNAQKYRDILEESLLPSVEMCQTAEGHFIFQQDGAPCHTAKTIKTWLQNHQIPVLKWTSSSPDLSPIETLWHNMKKQLRKHPARSVPELKATLLNIWDNILPEECALLVNTMSSRIKAVIKNKGDVTRY